MKFGNILKLAMDKQGVTVQEIAMKFCVVERTAYRWYVGDAEPDFERICELSKMMHIDLNQFADIIPDKDLINVIEDSKELEILQTYRSIKHEEQKDFLKAVHFLSQYMSK